jgi:hypothetical protein
VCEHRLPKAYDYHRFPAPFIQIRLLKLLAALGAGDKAASDNMYAVVQQVGSRASPGYPSRPRPGSRPLSCPLPLSPHRAQQRWALVQQACGAGHVGLAVG